MGRPLNKKYFGNRNIGSTSTTADDDIGGEGLAAYALAVQKGNLIVNLTYAQPELVIPAPDIPTGVQATATVVWEIERIVVTNGTTGQNYSNAAFTLTGLTGSSSTVTMAITTNGGGVHEPQTFSYAARGDWTTIPRVATTYAIAQAGSNGLAQCNVYFRVKSITTVEKGSGYIAAPTLSWTTAGTHTGGTAVGVPTVALTADTGGQYAGDNVGTVKGKNVSTYNENAIIAIDVSDDSIVDIIKQEGARRFKVKTATTTKFLNLTAPDDSTGLFIQATDSDGYDYWVKKISGHKATLIKYQPGGNARFADNTAVHWTFDAPTATTVKIRNA